MASSVEGCARGVPGEAGQGMQCPRDRKSTRLNSSHEAISYAVFCLKKKKKKKKKHTNYHQNVNGDIRKIHDTIRHKHRDEKVIPDAYETTTWRHQTPSARTSVISVR